MTDRRRTLRRRADRHSAQNVWLFVITLVVLVALWRAELGTDTANRVASRTARDQRSNTHALCALRSDLQTRVNSAQAFLAAHPHGIPGISPAVIEASTAGYQSTINALSPIRCTKK